MIKIFKNGILFSNGKKAKTPCLMTCATKGFLYDYDFEDFKKMGIEATVINALHLYINAKDMVLTKYSDVSLTQNLINFTDSGGFQMLSMMKKNDTIFDVKRSSGGEGVKIIKDNIYVKNYLDGTLFKWDVKTWFDWVSLLGADFNFTLDYYPQAYDNQSISLALNKTIEWSKLIAALNQKSQRDLGLYVVWHGGDCLELRRKHLRLIIEQIANGDFLGIAIGGYLGKDKFEMRASLSKFAGMLKCAVSEIYNRTGKVTPVHGLGIGASKEDVECAICSNINTVDCSYATKVARHGYMIGVGKVKNIDSFSFNDCKCYTCSNYTPDQIRYLKKCGNSAVHKLIGIHNVFVLNRFARLCK